MATGLIERQGISVNRIALVARVLNLPMQADLEDGSESRDRRDPGQVGRAPLTAAGAHCGRPRKVIVR
jgi:hypothetical protein